MTARQPTFADLEAQYRRKTTRREAFLSALDEAMPWEQVVAEAEAFRPKPGNGRPPIAAEVLVRMYVFQLAYNLSDEGCEDAVIDSAAARRFVGCGEGVPDASTLCRFRHDAEAAGFGARMLAAVNASLERRGVRMSAGTIVDATFVEASPSTKNEAGARDPEAHQAKKGNNWHFGYKAHVGVDARGGVVHTVVVTPANEPDIARAASLLRPGDREVWADAGYTGLGKRPEMAGSTAELHVAARRSALSEADLPAEAVLGAVRSAVEHPFHVVKDLMGHRKTRYRGLAKTENMLKACFALANLLLGRPGGRPIGPPAALSAKSMAKKAAGIVERRLRREREAAERAEREARKAEREARRAAKAAAAA